LASPVSEIVGLSGKVHLPLLRGMNEAIGRGDDRFTMEIGGRSVERMVHPRFEPCLPALQRRYAGLSAGAKEALQTLLQSTGCLEYLAT
jgi:hypothetical protein